MQLLLLFIILSNSVFSKKVFLDKNDLLSKTYVQILDVRNTYSFQNQRIKNSIHVDVNSLNDPKSIQSSILLERAQLQYKLQQYGVKQSKIYLILGLGVHKWGEDGRLFWILNNYSSSEVYLYDGGFKQYVHDFQKQISNGKSTVIQGDIVLDKQLRSISFENVQKHSGTIIDVRTTAEFLGATPFGSSRGGRIRNAISIPWSDFFTPIGKINIQNKTRILEKIDKNNGVVVYCTAGYRSALIYAVLNHWGVETQNYDGSWFEYSKRSKT